MGLGGRADRSISRDSLLARERALFLFAVRYGRLTVRLTGSPSASTLTRGTLVNADGVRQGRSVVSTTGITIVSDDGSLIIELDAFGRSCGSCVIEHPAYTKEHWAETLRDLESVIDTTVHVRPGLPTATSDPPAPSTQSRAPTPPALVATPVPQPALMSQAGGSLDSGSLAVTAQDPTARSAGAARNQLQSRARSRIAVAVPVILVLGFIGARLRLSREGTNDSLSIPSSVVVATAEQGSPALGAQPNPSSAGTTERQVNSLSAHNADAVMPLPTDLGRRNTAAGTDVAPAPTVAVVEPTRASQPTADGDVGSLVPDVLLTKTPQPDTMAPLPARMSKTDASAPIRARLALLATCFSPDAAGTQRIPPQIFIVADLPVRGPALIGLDNPGLKGSSVERCVRRKLGVDAWGFGTRTRTQLTIPVRYQRSTGALAVNDLQVIVKSR